MVPTLTEVLDASDWQSSAEVVGVAEPAPLDDEVLRAITRAVDATLAAALDDLRAQLRPRVEAAVRHALTVRDSSLCDGD